eukprot:4480143-Pyramimonas_sp.AAC.1
MLAPLMRLASDGDERRRREARVTPGLRCARPPLSGSAWTYYISHALDMHILRTTRAESGQGSHVFQRQNDLLTRGRAWSLDVPQKVGGNVGLGKDRVRLSRRGLVKGLNGRAETYRGAFLYAHLLALERAHDAGDAGVDGPRLVDDVEEAADHEEEDDHVHHRVHARDGRQEDCRAQEQTIRGYSIV